MSPMLLLPASASVTLVRKLFHQQDMTKPCVSRLIRHLPMNLHNWPLLDLSSKPQDKVMDISPGQTESFQAGQMLSTPLIFRAAMLSSSCKVHLCTSQDDELL